MLSQLKWLIVPWILFVYGFFLKETLPHYYKQYAPRLKAVSAVKASPSAAAVPAPQGKTALSPGQEAVTAVEAPRRNSQRDLTAGQAAPPPAPASSNHPFPANCGRILTALLIFAAAFAAGQKIFSLLKLPDPPGGGAAAALGLGLLSYAVFLLGILGALQPAPLWTLLAFLLIWGRREMLSAARRLKEAPICLRPLPLSLPLLAMAFLLFLGSFLPDFFYDTLFYHLALPQTYLLQHRIVPLPHNLASSFPQGAEMLYTLGLALGGNDTVPLLIQMGTGLLIAALILAGSRDAGRWGLLIWAACPLVVENLRFCKNDMALCLWLLASFLIVAQWRPEEGERALLPAALFAGLAMGTKYTGVTFTFLLILLLAWKLRHAGARRMGTVSALFAAAALLVFSPWLIKNLLFTGNPLYPFFQEIFGFRWMRPENWRSFLAENHQFPEGGWRLQEIFQNLWRSTFHGHLYPSMNFIGPLWLAFAPCMLFAARNRELRPHLAFATAAYCIGATQTVLARYFLLPALSIAAWLLVRSLLQMQEGALRRTLFVLLAAGVLFQSIGLLPAIESAAYGRKAIFGLSPERERPLYTAGYFDAFSWVNANLPENAKILFLGESRSHRFLRNVVAPSVHNEHPLSVLVEDAPDAEALYRALVEAGFTHILLNRGEFARLKGYPMFFWKKEKRDLVASFWERHLKEIRNEGPLSVYILVPVSGGGLALPEAPAGQAGRTGSAALPAEIADSFP